MDGGASDSDADARSAALSSTRAISAAATAGSSASDGPKCTFYAKRAAAGQAVGSFDSGRCAQ
jgi:hypothetical protein